MKRETQQERIQRMRREIERRGAFLHVDDNLPPDIIERFLMEVLTCRECGRPEDH